MQVALPGKGLSAYYGCRGDKKKQKPDTIPRLLFWFHTNPVDYSVR